MAEEPLVFISDKLSSDIGHLQTKPRHREGYGVWVTQNSPAKWKKRPLNFQELEYRRSGGDTTLVLCQDESPRATQAPMRHAWSDRASPGACGAVLASPACRGRASAARGHAALWEPGSGPRRVSSRGVSLSDAVAMRCVRLTAALNRAPPDPHPTGIRPGVAFSGRASCQAWRLPLSSGGPAGGARQ
jgi:hypothetical protein